MNTEPEDTAIIRAKADASDLDHKINVIKAEESRLESQRRLLESERNRIMAFVEMYKKYAEPSAAGGRQQTEKLLPNGIDSTVSDDRTERTSPRGSKKRRQALHRKPPGTPTTNDMILIALRDAQTRGLPGLAPKGMAAFIRQKWWPHLKGSSVGPAAWRMYQEKQLRKEGDLYALPAS